MPKLRVRVGPSTSEQDLVTVTPNTNEAIPVKSKSFDGQVVVHIKGLPDASGRQRDNAYFETREDVTWSIQVQGRFLKPCSADDVLFGNTFDRPLKLPMGSSFALRFMKLIDPTLDHDLASQKPWALSPLVSTMPHLMFSSTAPPPLSHTHTTSSSSSYSSSQSSGSKVSSESRSSGNSISNSPASSRRSCHSASSSLSSTSAGSSRARAFPPAPERGELILDERSPADITLKAFAISGLAGKKGGKKKDAAGERRKFFRDRDNRRKVVLGPEDTITTDFCYNFITFPDLRLCLPGGLSFDLARYWDGQPVRFVCCRRPQESEGGMGSISERDIDSENVFWCVSIERMDD